MKGRVIVFGAQGMLGTAVCKTLAERQREILQYDKHNFDILKENSNKLKEIIKCGDSVINCAGLIKPLIPKFSQEEVLKVNSMFPKNLALLCHQLGAACLHISTDAVFDGLRGNYLETELAEAEDFYGLSKLAGESDLAMVLRVSIIGEERNTAFSLLEWARSQRGKTISGYTNHRWNGLTTMALAEAIDDILFLERYQPGVFHVYSPRVVSKYELLGLINRSYDLNLKIEASQAEISYDRSLSSVYSLSSELIKEDIEAMLNRYAKKA